MRVRLFALTAACALLVGCGSSRDAVSSNPHAARPAQPHPFKVDKRHSLYRARIFTSQLRGAAHLPMHVDGPDGTREDIRADEDGRVCLIVPEVNAESGTVLPAITLDWSGIDEVRPAETTRFAKDDIVHQLGSVPGFLVAPDVVTGTDRDRPISLGLLQSQDWRGGQDDAATCHLIENGHDRIVENAAIPGGGPATAKSYAPRDVAILTTARALARQTATRVDACFTKARSYVRCGRGGGQRWRKVPGGLIRSPITEVRADGYRVFTETTAGTYTVERTFKGAPRTESCRAIRVSSCPPGLAP